MLEPLLSLCFSCLFCSFILSTLLLRGEEVAANFEDVEFLRTGTLTFENREKRSGTGLCSAEDVSSTEGCLVEAFRDDPAKGGTEGLSSTLSGCRRRSGILGFWSLGRRSGIGGFVVASNFRFRGSASTLAPSCRFEDIGTT